MTIHAIASGNVVIGMALTGTPPLSKTPHAMLIAAIGLIYVVVALRTLG